MWGWRWRLRKNRRVSAACSAWFRARWPLGGLCLRSALSSYLVVEVPDEPLQEAAHHGDVEGLGEDHEVHPALGADRGHRGHRVQREPVARAPHDRGTPLLPQVRPVTWSERTSTWLAKGISPPSAFALARVAGQVSSCQRRTASGSCSTARLSGRWKESPHRLGYLPTPGSVSRTRYSFAIRSPISLRVHNCPTRPTSHGRYQVRLGARRPARPRPAPDEPPPDGPSAARAVRPGLRPATSPTSCPRPSATHDATSSRSRPATSAATGCDRRTSVPTAADAARPPADHSHPAQRPRITSVSDQ